MCLMIYAPKGKVIPPEHIRIAVENNPHGWGVMYRSEAERVEGAIRSSLDMNMNRAEGLMSTLAGHELVFHARAGTQGTLSWANIHPFRLKMENQGDEHLEESWMLAHNGVFGGLTITEPEKSDTWHFCRVLERAGKSGKFDLLTTLERPELLTAFEEWIKPWNKLCFAGPYGFYIVNEKEGVWIDGIWYSNDQVLHGKRNQVQRVVRNLLKTDSGGAVTWGDEYTKTAHLKPAEATGIILAELWKAADPFDCALSYACEDPQPVAILLAEYAQMMREKYEKEAAQTGAKVDSDAV